MSVLPLVCIGESCGRTYGGVNVSRHLEPDAKSSGLCPDCTRKMENQLFGRRTTVIGVFEKRWCRCGREIVTGKAACEICEVGA